MSLCWSEKQGIKDDCPNDYQYCEEYQSRTLEGGMEGMIQNRIRDECMG
jgi:hypothetical protein